MTHDSIGLGEDGPTHQPVEVMELLRATPNMYAFRPADGNEVSTVVVMNTSVVIHIWAMKNGHSPYSSDGVLMILDCR